MEGKDRAIADPLLVYAPYDLHDGVLGKPDIAANQPVGQAFFVHGQHPLRLLV